METKDTAANWIAYFNELGEEKVLDNASFDLLEAHKDDKHTLFEFDPEMGRVIKAKPMKALSELTDAERQEASELAIKYLSKEYSASNTAERKKLIEALFHHWVILSIQYLSDCRDHKSDDLPPLFVEVSDAVDMECVLLQLDEDDDDNAWINIADYLRYSCKPFAIPPVRVPISEIAEEKRLQLVKISREYLTGIRKPQSFEEIKNLLEPLRCYWRIGVVGFLQDLNPSSLKPAPQVLFDCEKAIEQISIFTDLSSTLPQQNQ